MIKDIDFMGKSKIWMTISVIIILLGFASMYYNKKVKNNFLNLGIDFTGGTSMLLRMDKIKELGKDGLTEKERMRVISDIRGVLAKEGLADSVIQIISGNDIIINVSPIEDAKRKSIIDNLNKNLGKTEQLEVDTIGPTIGAELREKALWMIMVSIVGLLLYITWRYEFIFSVGAVLSMVHDCLIIIGIASILYMKIDSAFVAAILTILGYSINDTIVVFDRIRENNHLLRRKENLFNISNISINQTLSRTIITGLSAMITLLCVYIFGGMTTKDFALILLIGFIFGTYSSIMIASPVVVWFKGKE